MEIVSNLQLVRLFLLDSTQGWLRYFQIYLGSEAVQESSFETIERGLKFKVNFVLRWTCVRYNIWMESFTSRRRGTIFEPTDPENILESWKLEYVPWALAEDNRCKPLDLL